MTFCMILSSLKSFGEGVNMQGMGMYALKDVKVETRISEEQKRELQAYAKKHKMTVAMVIRLIVDEKIKEERSINEQARK